MEERMAMELRPEVRAFAEAMQQLLDAHQGEKGDGWKGDSPEDLIASTYRACDRLARAYDFVAVTTDAILTRAASVGVHAMFVADVCGALGEERTGDEV
jgi:hypothetical protein